MTMNSGSIKISDFVVILLQVMDIAHYHGQPDVFIKDINKFWPSIIFIGWCFSSNGDVSISYLVSLLLTSSNCCPNPGGPGSEE